MNRSAAAGPALSDARPTSQSPGKRDRLGHAGWATIVGLAVIICAAFATRPSGPAAQYLDMFQQSSLSP